MASPRSTARPGASSARSSKGKAPAFGSRRPSGASATPFGSKSPASAPKSKPKAKPATRFTGGIGTAIQGTPGGKTITLGRSQRAVNKVAAPASRKTVGRAAGISAAEKRVQSRTPNKKLPPAASRGRGVAPSVTPRPVMNSMKPSSRSTPGGGDERGTVTRLMGRPGAAPQQVAVNPGGLAGFAKGVSDNFGRGVAEVGRQLGSVQGPNFGSGPLQGNSLGRAVNAADQTPGGNPLKKILKR